MVNAKTSTVSKEMEEVRQIWVEMYSKILPGAAKSRLKAQPVWPVSLDHCFARIILDNAIGQDSPWTAKIKSPAYKNMSVNQLREATSLGQDILDGKQNLEMLNRKSLELRNKSGPKRKQSSLHSDIKHAAKTIKTEDTLDEKHDAKDEKHDAKDEQHDAKDEQQQQHKKHDENNDSTGAKKEADGGKSYPGETANVKAEDHADFDISVLEKTSDLTIFRRKVLELLYTVPRGQWTTYKAMSDALSSSPRAVGNAMRNNPYAPMIPCHRVLASDGNIGGFGGDWGADGRHASQKIKLLREEGIRFDGKGKVVGRPFTFPT